MSGQYLWLERSHPSVQGGRRLERATVLPDNNKPASPYHDEFKKLSAVIQAANITVRSAVTVDTGILINSDVFHCLKEAVRSFSDSE